MLEFVLGVTAGTRAGTGRSASLARSAAVGEATIHTNRIEDLNERIDSMALILRAMWSLMEENGVTTEQLVDKMEELDRLDGTEDGAIARRAPVDCPSCDSKVAPGLASCQFCGADILVEDDHPLGSV